MRRTVLRLCILSAFAGVGFAGPGVAAEPAALPPLPLGLPPVPIPADNPQTPEKVKLGDKLFNDTRFSSNNTVSCATCHDPKKAFTDRLALSKGVNDLLGTRNAPTVINSAYFTSQFWDGREPSLEQQSLQPIVNPVEMALPDHEPVLKIVRTDPEYQKMFQQVFNKTGEQVTMTEVKQAIAAFERTVISGNSPFDRFQYGGDKNALSPAAQRGLKVYLNQGRCVSCHTIEQTHALFTNNRFHNIGVGFKRVQEDIPGLASAFLEAKAKGMDVDKAVLSNKNSSELGRFAVDDEITSMGGFKTPTLRNVAKTQPYMHDGSLKTLAEVVDWYNNGGKLKETDPSTPYLDGGIRPLNLTDQEKKDLVAFLESLTSPEFEDGGAPAKPVTKTTERGDAKPAARVSQSN